MRIALLAPLFESIPPRVYGGTERVVSYLTEELVRQGHDVTLFATGDSITTSHLSPITARALRLDPNCIDPIAPHILMLGRAFRRIDEFDILHFHSGYLHYPLLRMCPHPALTTVHGRLDIPELEPLHAEFRDISLVSISDSQRRPLEGANWAGTVYHGLPRNLYVPRYEAGTYLAFLGRISPEKRPDRAIEIANRAGIPLKIAAKVDRVDREYFDTVIRPLLRTRNVEFLGEINDREKESLLSHAYCLLFPIDWEEPFGLVMIEAMACGTPVVAFDRGSVREVVTEGRSGFIVTGVEEAVSILPQVGTMDRRQCRKAFEERFTAERMTRDYVQVYLRIIDRFEGKLAYV